MIELFEAIHSYVQANHASPFYSAIGGRFYFERAKQTATKPYAVYHDAGYELNYYFSHISHIHRVEINIWDDGKSDTAYPESPRRLLTTGGYCTTLFDLARPTVSGWNVIGGMLRSEHVQPPILYDDERKEWCYPLLYTIRLQQEKS